MSATSSPSPAPPSRSSSSSYTTHAWEVRTVKACLALATLFSGFSTLLYLLVPTGTVVYFGGAPSPTASLWCSLAGPGDAINALWCVYGLRAGTTHELRAAVRGLGVFGVAHMGAYARAHFFFRAHPGGGVGYVLGALVGAGLGVVWGVLRPIQVPACGGLALGSSSMGPQRGVRAGSSAGDRFQPLQEEEQLEQGPGESQETTTAWAGTSQRVGMGSGSASPVIRRTNSSSAAKRSVSDGSCASRPVPEPSGDAVDDAGVVRAAAARAAAGVDVGNGYRIWPPQSERWLRVYLGFVCTLYGLSAVVYTVLPGGSAAVMGGIPTPTANSWVLIAGAANAVAAAWSWCALKATTSLELTRAVRGLTLYGVLHTICFARGYFGNGEQAAPAAGAMFILAAVTAAGLGALWGWLNPGRIGHA